MPKLKTAMHAKAADADTEYLCEYDFGGETWCLHGICANDEDEARQKLRSIGTTGRVLGGLAVSVPFTPRTHLLIFLLGALAGVLVSQML